MILNLNIEYGREDSMKKKKGILLTILVTAVVMLFLFYNAGRLLVVNESIKKCDAIVVLSGDKGERTEYGVKLLKEGYANYLVLSGGVVYNKQTMADLMKKHAVELGVKETQVLLEEKSDSTFENAKFSKKLLDKYDIKSAIIVTSDYHSLRSKLVFKKAFNKSNINLIFQSCKDRNFSPEHWWSSSKSIMCTITEYIKIAGYFIKGYL